MSRGHDRERDLRAFLSGCGWLCIRAAGSLGPVDLAAVAQDRAIYPRAMLTHVLEHGLMPRPRRGGLLLIECKSTSRPFERFGPADRRELLELADSVGAGAWLAFKPKGAAGWAWIPSWRWPTATADLLRGRPSISDGNLPKTLSNPHRSG
jgi:Holliday junction resolvase